MLDCNSRKKTLAVVREVRALLEWGGRTQSRWSGAGAFEHRQGGARTPLEQPAVSVRTSQQQPAGDKKDRREGALSSASFSLRA